MRVQQFSKSGDFIKEFASESEAAHELGLTSSLIKWVCEGKRNYHGGFVWRYAEEVTEPVSEPQVVSCEVSSSDQLACVEPSLKDITVSKPIYIIFYHAGFSSKPLDYFYLSLDNAIDYVRTLLSDSELQENDSLERNHINKYRYYLRNSNYYEIVCLTEGDSYGKSN